MEGVGELAGLLFRVKIEGAADVRFSEAAIRGITNEALLTGTEDLEASCERPLPTVSRLTGVIPSPFNPTTTVHYELHQPSHVLVQVYDLNGRVVRTLVDGSRAAGAYEAVWDGRDNRGRATGSGVYFIRMQAGDYAKTTKAVMLK